MNVAIAGCATLVCNPGCAELALYSVLAEYDFHAEYEVLYDYHGPSVIDVYDADDVWVGHIDVTEDDGRFEFEYHSF